MTRSVTVDPSSTTPPYEQLRRQLEMQIRGGILKPGDRLPTVRQLAADLALAKNTVVRAFRELENAGLIAGAGRNGTIVLQRTTDTDERSQIIQDAARRLVDDTDTIAPTIDELTNAIARLLNQPRPSHNAPRTT